MRWTLSLLAVAVLAAPVLLSRHRDALSTTNHAQELRPAGIAPVRASNVPFASAGHSAQSPAPPHREAIKASTTAAEAAAQAAARIAQGQ